MNNCVKGVYVIQVAHSCETTAEPESKSGEKRGIRDKAGSNERGHRAEQVALQIEEIRVIFKHLEKW